MKSIFTALCAAFVLVACNNETKDAQATNDTAAASTTTAASSKTSEEWVPVDSATAMQTMIAAGTPGPEHAMLAKENGLWNAEVTMWNAPGEQPMTSKGTMTNKMIMGGRYQQSTFKGDMMGMPFEGLSTVGYDNASKKWVSTWVDNMSTMIMTLEGKWDEASKSAVYTGQMLCPANGKMCEIKQVMKPIDDKTTILEMYGPDLKTGKQYKNMEMKLTKA